MESTGAQRLLSFPVVSSQTSGSYDRLKRDRLSADPGRCEEPASDAILQNACLSHLIEASICLGWVCEKKEHGAVNDEGLGGYMAEGSVVASLNSSAPVRL